MKAQIEMITPAFARQALDQNPMNRSISNITVERYAREMKEGRWNNNGQPIIFAEDGTLLDGQHRMQAILHAQEPIGMWVIRGVPKENFVTIDTGRVRNLSDVLNIEGYSNTKLIAGMAKAAYNYASGLHFNRPLTTPVLNDFINNHPRIKDVASEVAQEMRGTRLPKVPLAAVVFLGNESRAYDKEAREFIEGVASGAGLWEGDPRLTLREWVNKNRSSQNAAGGSLRTEMVFAATARAWTAFAAGDALPSIRLLAKPSRATTGIRGFDQALFQDVPDLALTSAIRRQENLVKARAASPLYKSMLEVKGKTGVGKARVG